MKILQVITSLETGGAECLVVNMVARLRAMGHEADVCVFNGQETPLMERLRKECPQAKIYKLGHGYYNPLYILKLLRLMRRYDIVHTHNSSPQLLVAIASVLCSVGLCSTEHNTSNRKRHWKWYAPIESWMYGRYGHVVCISQIAEEKLREYMGGDWLVPSSKKYGRISTINNGIDVAAFFQAAPLGELAHDGRFTTVMVAGFREAKDQDTLVRAMALLPDAYELWLVGVGVREPEVRKLVKELHLESRVRFLGMRMDVPRVLKSADVVAMSSHWEGLSLSNLEGMSVGKPFVASEVNGLREVTQGAGILFPHGDAKALADIIRRLHDDSTYYEAIAQACHLRAMKYDIGEMVRKYEKVYENLMK